MTFSLALSSICMSAIQASAEYTLITDPADTSGSDYTDSPALAAQLDEIFEGNAGVYRDSSCTRLVDTTLGTSPVKNNGVYMYVGEENEELKAGYIALIGLAKRILETCIDLLAFSAPDKM